MSLPNAIVSRAEQVQRWAAAHMHLSPAPATAEEHVPASPLLTTPAPNVDATPAPQEKTMSFKSILNTVEQDAEKGLAFVIKYVLPVGSLVSMIFPPSAPYVAEATTSVDLIQKAVVSVEQKYAASGVATGTGQQKLAEVLLLTQQAVTDLLTMAGVKVDADYVTRIVNAVVAILNVQMVSTPAAA